MMMNEFGKCSIHIKNKMRLKLGTIET